MPDGSWKGAPEPVRTPLKVEIRDMRPGRRARTLTGGTGTYQGAGGGGTYMDEGLTDTLFGGKYKGKLELP